MMNDMAYDRFTLKNMFKQLEREFSEYSLQIVESSHIGKTLYEFALNIHGHVICRSVGDVSLQKNHYIMEAMIEAIQSAIDAENDDCEVQATINSNPLPEESIEDGYDLDISNLLVSKAIPLSTEY